MWQQALDLYACPKCSQPLKREGNSYTCDENHSFDVAKEGYVNLLLANQKKSKEPGDSKEMIVSRRAFLESGFYGRLSDTLNQTVASYINDGECAILDAGCGEGYYLRQLAQYLESQFKTQAHLYGLDVSKPAIIAAAKKAEENVAYAVGNTYHLPYADTSFNVVFSVFSPFLPLELHRVLAKDGTVIVVGPGKNHLKELANIIYPNVQPHEGNPATMSGLFSLTEEKEITYTIDLVSADIMNLLAMTPYYWSITLEKKEALQKLQNLTVSLDFQMKVYKSV